MKHLGIFILGALLLASCATNKRAAYIQQVQTDIPTDIEQDYQIRIKPLDRLTVTINSKDPELAAARSIHRSPQDNSMRDAEYVSFRPFLSDSDRKNRKIRQHPKYFTFQPFPRRIIGKKVISLRNHSKH
ncbi:MAG: hypothetical protein ACLSEC_09575 [Alistipes communis]|uniref:hypothetical protein n=1 Tax=Alistipes communis TaxID=2585118 RepID=UPI0039910F85